MSAEWADLFRRKLAERGYEAVSIDYDPAFGWELYLGGELVIEARSTPGVQRKIAALPIREKRSRV